MKKHLHISDIHQFLACRRSWSYSSNLRQNLTTIKPYEPFYFGTCMHALLEYHYDFQRKGGWIRGAEFLERQPNAIQEFIDFGVALMDHYSTWQSNDPSEMTDHNFSWLGLEQDFNVPIWTPLGNRSTRFDFCGTVDGVFRHRIDQRLYLHEIKTTSSIDRRIPQLAFELQPTAYMYAMEQVYQEPIAGVVYTLIRKKLPADPDVLKNGDLSKNKGIDTTAENYVKCVRAHHEGITNAELKTMYGDVIQTLLNEPNKFFRRILVKRSVAELQQFHEQLYYLARDMTNPRLPLYHSPGYFCADCLFSQPCLMQSRGENPATFLRENYHRNARLDR